MFPEKVAAQATLVHRLQSILRLPGIALKRFELRIPRRHHASGTSGAIIRSNARA
jgi:hypothetical protein